MVDDDDDDDEEAIVEKPITKRGRFAETQENIENIEPSQAQVVEQVVETVKPKRGRKPGSKNKPKVTTTTTTTTTTTDRPVPRRGRPSKAEKGKALAEEN